MLKLIKKILNKFSCKSKCRGEEECECKYNKTSPIIIQPIGTIGRRKSL